NERQRAPWVRLASLVERDQCPNTPGLFRPTTALLSLSMGRLFVMGFPAAHSQRHGPRVRAFIAAQLNRRGPHTSLPRSWTNASFGFDRSPRCRAPAIRDSWQTPKPVYTGHSIKSPRIASV